MPRPGVLQAELKPEELKELKFYLSKHGLLEPNGRGDGYGPSTAKHLLRPFIKKMRELYDDEFRRSHPKG